MTMVDVGLGVGEDVPWNNWEGEGEEEVGGDEMEKGEMV